MHKKHLMNLTIHFVHWFASTLLKRSETSQLQFHRRVIVHLRCHLFDWIWINRVFLWAASSYGEEHTVNKMCKQLHAIEKCQQSYCTAQNYSFYCDLLVKHTHWRTKPGTMWNVVYRIKWMATFRHNHSVYAEHHNQKHASSAFVKYL